MSEKVLVEKCKRNVISPFILCEIILDTRMEIFDLLILEDLLAYILYCIVNSSRNK